MVVFFVFFHFTISVNQLLQVQENVNEVYQKLIVVIFSCGINAINLQSSNFCLHCCIFPVKSSMINNYKPDITCISQNNAKNNSWFPVHIFLNQKIDFHVNKQYFSCQMQKISIMIKLW